MVTYVIILTDLSSVYTHSEFYNRSQYVYKCTCKPEVSILRPIASVLLPAKGLRIRKFHYNAYFFVKTLVSYNMLLNIRTTHIFSTIYTLSVFFYCKIKSYVQSVKITIVHLQMIEVQVEKKIQKIRVSRAGERQGQQMHRPRAPLYRGAKNA